MATMATEVPRLKVHGLTKRFGDHSVYEGPARSNFYRWFTDPRVREHTPEDEYELTSRTYVANLRAVHGRDSGDAEARDLVELLRAESPEFARLWDEHEVAVRREWIQRIIDHDGTSDGTGGIESWLRLGEALAVTRAELESERGVLPGVRYAVDAYVNFARQRPWIEAVASSLTELFGPAAIRIRLEALERHYDWIDPAGLEYFRTRLVKAPRDAEYALELVVDRCRTRDQQDAAVAALKFKTEVLWAQLDAIERGDTHDTVSPNPEAL